MPKSVRRRSFEIVGLDKNGRILAFAKQDRRGNRDALDELLVAETVAVFQGTRHPEADTRGLVEMTNVDLSARDVLRAITHGTADDVHVRALGNAVDEAA